MSDRMFVGHAQVASWVELGRAELDGGALTLRAGGDAVRRYRLEPAVRFLRIVGAEADPHGLLARVKTEAQVRDLGGELLGDSVLLGEVAYEVEGGFLAEGGDGRDPAGAGGENLG